MLKSRFAFVSALGALAIVLMAAGSRAETSGAERQQQADNGGAAPDTLSPCFGSPVEQIVFPGVNAADRQMLQSLVAVRAGQRLDRERLEASLRSLYQTGRFADLKAECEAAGGGSVVVSFVQTPNFFIGRVTVTGAPGRPSQSQIVNASKLELGELFTDEKIERALTNIKRLLEENDFYRARVSHSERRNPSTQQVEVTFVINAGEAARVGQVTVEGHPLFSTAQIEDIARLHPGDVTSAARISTALDRLRKQYQKRRRWLAQVAVAGKKYLPERNRVDYTFLIEAGPPVEIRAEGFRLASGTLKRNVPVYEEHALDDDLLNEGRRNLLAYMESRGFFDAQVELRRESDASGGLVRVIYHIDPGERHRVVKVAIRGNHYFREPDLRAAMQVQATSLLAPHGRFSRALLRSDVRDMESKYRANGFSKVKIDTRVEDDYRGVKNQIAVTVDIEEGPQTLVGKFSIVGNLTQPEQSFPPLNTQSGQPYSDVNVAQDRDIVLNYYFNNGYPQATFEASVTPASNNHMDVTFTIQEGERIFVDQVLVSGREFTLPYVIDHELEMSPNDPLSQGDMLGTQQKLYDLGIFSQVDTAVQNPEGVETRKNVLVEVEEAKRYTFTYGLGFEFQTGQPTNKALGATGVSPLASFDVTRLNFRGRDHTITFQSRVGGLQQRGLVSYEAPHWFNNPDWKLTFTGFFDHTLSVATFTSQRLEGSAQAEQVLTRKADRSPSSIIDYRFDYRLVKASNLQISPELIPLFSQPVRVGEPVVGYIRNHRDNDLETTRGSYITVDAGVAAHYFGSQADFSRVLVQYATYYPFGKQSKSTRQFVFARSTRVGLENPFSNTIIVQPGEGVPPELALIPLPERFFMGGGNSHRGFGLNQAGPRDPLTGFPTGGGALFLNNLELRFPPPTLPLVHENMSFALFHDMGNVFTDGTHMLDSLLRWHQAKQLCSPLTSPSPTQCNYNYISHAIGVGVRYKTPVGPVRFDFGYSLNPTIYPQFVQNTFVTPKQASPFNVYFSIGQTF